MFLAKKVYVCNVHMGPYQYVQKTTIKNLITAFGFS